jgi:hypothetical protein
MTRLVLALLAVAALAVTAAAQPTAEQAKRSEEVLRKVRMLDLYNHILPVLITSDQARQILPAIEKARQRVRDIQKQEALDMAALESKLDSALKAATDTGQVPGRPILAEVQKLFRNFTLRRALAAEENAQVVAEVFKKTLNEGQRKAAANSLNLSLISPGMKVEEMTEDDKLHVYIREIILDPAAYDVLVAISLKKD